ncbi:uncharacterized protein LOC143885418 isoform X2 [Tasmannia lanceolata]|uniref:uncharacterized protein LOC143885418 isoform X2 n=1 Tax=Tasmannia lanceolata TaxID=3420 RepID=UPI004063D1AB
MASSLLPWAWALETLATFKEADTDLLQDLLDKVSDISGDSFKNTKERVSLRYVEEFLDKNPTNGRNSLSIDVSEPSEDVLRKVATSDDLGKCGAELKHNLSQFILQKRATLPEHALDQLKDSILEDCYPSASSLRERSCLAKENAVHCLDQSRICAYGDDEYQIAKRLKANTDDGKIQSLKQNLALLGPENRNGISQQDPHGRILRSGRRVPRQNIHVRDKKEYLLGNVVRANDDSVQLLKRKSTPVNRDKMPQRAPSNGPLEHEAYHQNIFVESTPGNRDKMPQGAPSNGPLEHEASHQNIFVESTPDNRDKMPQGAPSNGPFEHEASHQNNFVDEAKDGGGPDVIPETSSSSDGDRDPDCNFYPNGEMISAEKQKYLSSQNLIRNDSLTMDWTENRSCIKCDRGGQVLICSRNGCPISIHESCFDTSVSFENGEFYCPFCSYSRAYSEYRKAKQKAAMARKALSIFMGRDLVHGHRKKQPPVRVPRKLSEVRVAENANCPNEILADQQNTELINNHLCDRVVENIESNNRNSPCGEEGTSLTNGRKSGYLEIVGDGQRINAVEHQHQVEPSSDGQGIKAVEHQQQVEPSSACNNDNLPCREAETILINETHGGSPIKAKSDNTEMVDNSPCISEVKLQKKAETAPDDNVANAPCRGKASPIRKGQNAVIQRTSPRNQKGKDISNKPIKCRRPTRRYSILPSMRRNKLLWTVEEEETLEEAVQKFSKSGETTPWVKILEFGHNVFHRTRTPADLKDKWRNIMIKKGLARKRRRRLS